MNAPLLNVRHPSDGVPAPASRLSYMVSPRSLAEFRLSSNIDRRTSSALCAFTVLEILVATALLTVIVSLLFSIFGKMSDAWIYGEATVDRQRTSRTALELLSRELSQAMITTNTANAIKFIGSSNWVYFVAPVAPFPGQASDLAEFGYQYISAISAPTNFWRYYVSPSTNNTAWDPYRTAASIKSAMNTSSSPFTSPPASSSTVAENVLDLSFKYYNASGGGPFYTWDSTSGNTLPSVIEVTMLVMDSRNARRTLSLINMLQNARTNTAVIHLSNAP